MKLLYWLWWHIYDRKDAHRDDLTLMQKADRLARLQSRLNALGDLKELVNKLREV